MKDVRVTDLPAAAGVAGSDAALVVRTIGGVKQLQLVPVGMVVGMAGTAGPVVLNNYSAKILAPLRGASVSGVIDVVVQSAGVVAMTLTDASGKTLATGVPDGNNLTRFSVDSALFGTGAQTIKVAGYDQPLGQAYAHAAFDAVQVSVAVPVTTPGPATVPPPPTSGATSSVTPASSAAEAWLHVGDQTSVTASSGKISQVNDKKNTHNAAQATSANQPANSASAINGLYASTFNGSGAQSLTIPAQSAINNIWAGGATLMAVVTPKSGGSSQFGRLFDKGSWRVEFNSSYGLEWIGLVVQSGGSVSGFWNWSLSGVGGWGKPMLLEIDYNSDALGNVPTARFNGVPQPLVQSSSAQPTGTLDSDTANPLTIGNAIAGNKPYDGDFEDLLIFPASASDTDRTNVRAWAATTFNLPIAGSNIVTTPTTTVPGSGGNTATPGTVVAGAAIPSFAKGTGVTPQVTAVASKGYSLIADFTMGSTAGTIKDIPTLAQVANLGLPYPGVTRLNDELEFYGAIDGTTHVMATDHLKLRASVYNQALLDAQIARCLATSGQPTPDGHDWGSYQGGPANGAPPGGYDCGIQSGCISFKNTQRYGYFEAKLQIPKKKAQWPAFWGVALGGWPPEFDFLEQVKNDNPDNEFNAYHNCALAWKDGVDKNVTPAINQKVAISSLLDQYGSYPAAGGTVTDYSAAPHIYAAEWFSDVGRDRWIVYVDSTVVWEGYYPWVYVDTARGIVTGPADPMTIIVDHAIGGNWAGRLGAIQGTTWPVDFLVYWVRFYGK